VTSTSAAVAAAPLARPVARGRTQARYLTVGVLAILLLVGAGATLMACYLAVTVPEQLDEGEPLIYGLAYRILQHQPLYQSIDHQPFVQAHYTPIYYYAIAALRRYVASGFAPGRILSIFAGLFSTVLVAYLATSRARVWWTGGFAALMFLGLGFPGGPAPFMALVRVDMLGIAFAVLAVAVLSHGSGRLHLIVAGVCAGAAILTKQSLFAVGLAGTLWLLTLDRRKAAVFASVSVATLLVPGLLLQWSTAGAFWENVGPDNPSPTALEFGAYLFREMLVIQGIPSVLALLYVVQNRAWVEPRQRLIVLYWLATMIPVFGIIKVGSNHNYWIEFAAANSILAALAIWRCTRPGSRGLHTLGSTAPTLVLAFGLAVLTPARFIRDRDVSIIPLSWTLDLERFSLLAEQAPGFKKLMTDVSGEKGKILAESMDIAVLGDQPVEFEPFAFSMLEYEGRWNSDSLVDDICSGRITLLVLVYPIEVDIHPVGLKQFPMWPNSVMTALRRTMQFEQVRDWHFLYRSPRSLDPPAIAACKSAAAAARG
jgi:hypothetical protein